MRIDDPWYDTLASGRGEGCGGPPSPDPGAGSARARPGAGGDARAAARTTACLAVHRGAAFREARRRHRRFVLTAAACLLTCHLAYAVASATVPDLMARTPGGGPLTVGTLAALAQPVVALVVVRAHLGHARLYRDGTALELRWYAQDLAHSASAGTGGVGGLGGVGGSFGAWDAEAAREATAVCEDPGEPAR